MSIWDGFDDPAKDTGIKKTKPILRRIEATTADSQYWTEKEAVVSTAVSLKRIADALEKLVDHHAKPVRLTT